MIDWDRLVVESEHNGVIASAGEVALLVGADAAGVTWGNITGDVTQQADLMALVDGFAPVDSPQFTGIPRTVTPPEGNNSTRIASTAFVEKELQRELTPYAKTADFGGLAYENTIDYTGNLLTNKPTLGALAAQNYITTDNIQYEQYLFVDASRGSDSNPGDNVNYPLKTIYAAIQKAKSPATTMIQIYPGTYTEMPNINNKSIELYSLADDENSPVIITTPIYASESTIYLYGIMRITGIQASGSTIFYFPLSGSYLHTTSRMEISGGSVLNVFPGIYFESGLTTALRASSGSIITVGTVTWPLNDSMTTVMQANGGIIQYVNFSQSLSCGTFKSELNNGKVFQIENFEDAPASGDRKMYLRSTIKYPAGGTYNYWAEAGDLAMKDDAPDVSSQYGRNYVRKSYMVGDAHVHEWEDMDPPMDSSENTTKKWVRVHPWSDMAHPGYWQELDEPPESMQPVSNPDLYARASYRVLVDGGYVQKYKWVKINL